MPKVYQQTLDHIQAAEGNNKIWVSIDETTDSLSHYVTDITVGVICNTTWEIILLTHEDLQKMNTSVSAQLFNNSLSLLWPHCIKHDNVLLFLTDVTAYMLKTANSIKVLYPKLVHITCVVHELEGH